MSAYIRSAQDNIRKISSDIHTRAQNCNVRYALVKYRDHPPQDSSFITEVFPFTTKIEVMKRNIDTMAASGGGDGPEAVAAALHEVHSLEWRANATKICVLIADAPPHGLGESGDGFPNGCPQGHDPIVTSRSLASKGVIVYAVGVEPVLSTQYKFARDFMMTVAKITEGKFLPLGRADVLSDVIVSGAIEGLNLAEIWGNIENDVKAEAAKKGENIAESELIARTERKMADCKVEVQQVAMQNPYEAGYDYANCDALACAPSLQQAQQQLRSSLNAHAPTAAASFAWGGQEKMCVQSAMTEEQVMRKGGHAKKSRGLW